MIQRMLAGGLIAGFAAGLFAALLHFAFIQELILLGEEYESGALVHFAGVGEGAAEVGHSHAEGEAPHDHDDEGAEGEGSGFSRNANTMLFYGLLYASYGLVLVAGFALAAHFGRAVAARDGVLWGIAGFVAVQLAPAMGLAPELPGSVAADITERQVWWYGTMLLTGGGLALLAFGKNAVAALVGFALLAAPHVVGAPLPEGFHGVAPPEVAGEYAARVLGVGFFAWAVLGWLAARLWARGA